MNLKSFTSALLVIAMALILASTQTVSADEWKSLFNGKDTSGWAMTGPGEFKIEDGHLVTYGGMGLLYYEKEKFGDCEIKIVFKMTNPNDNSGVYIRIKDIPDDPWFAVHNGYEAQISNSTDPKRCTGSIYSFVPARQSIKAEPGEYVTYIIRLEGNRTILSVNGVVTADYTEGKDKQPPKGTDGDPDRGPRVDKGYIGLQNHDEDSRIHFKEVSVRSIK